MAGGTGAKVWGYFIKRAADGKTVDQVERVLMFPIDLEEAVKKWPQDWSYEPPKVKAAIVDKTPFEALGPPSEGDLVSTLAAADTPAQAPIRPS